MATDPGLRRLREKHYQTSFPKRPSFIDEESWAIFTAYVFEGRSLRSMREGKGMSPSRLRQILFEVDTQLERSHGMDGVGLQSAIEKLELSNRARNALHRLGCRTGSRRGWRPSFPRDADSTRHRSAAQLRA